MLNQTEISAIARDVALTNLPEGSLVSASSRPYDGPYGADELMVDVVIKKSDFDKVTGRQFNKIVGDLQQRLIERGESRFANIHWDADASNSTDG